jgi:hypothetical protein
LVLLEPLLKAQLQTGFCVQVSGVRRSNGKHDQVVEDQVSRVTSLNRNIHTGNMGAVILFKRGGGGGSRRRVAMVRKAASASGCAEVGSLQCKVLEGGCS